MQLQFVGSGDAFGSGGRFNTCFHVVGSETNFLIDCGASSLIAIGRDADLFVSEAYVYDKPLPLHLSYRQLVEKLPLIRPKRLILTHMSDDMLGRGDAIAHETAEDGMIIKI